MQIAYANMVAMQIARLALRVKMMRKANLRNLLQIVALSAPPVLMALAGLLLRRSPKRGGLAQKLKPKHRDQP